MNKYNTKMDNGLLSNHHSLKEHEGSFCSKCNLFYFSKISKCNECDSITEPKKWYSRFCLERIIFIITLSIISKAVVPFITSNADAQWLVPLLTALILFSAYHTAQYFLGIGSMFLNNWHRAPFQRRKCREKNYLFSLSFIFNWNYDFLRFSSISISN